MRSRVSSARKATSALRARGVELPFPLGHGREGGPVVGATRFGQVAQRLEGALADAARGHVDDALEGRHVVVVAQGAQVGQRILDLAALVEAGATDQLIAQAIAQERFLDGAALGIGAIHDRHVLQPVFLVVAVIRPP